MPVTTVQNVALEFEITYQGQPLEFSCQVIDAEISLPGIQPGEATETACPDGIVIDPGSTVKGSITGNAYVDPADTGVTWALATLYQAGTTFPYSITYWADQANTIAITFTGEAVVNSFKLPFTKPGNAKFPIDLALSSAVMSRPVAA